MIIDADFLKPTEKKNTVITAEVETTNAFIQTMKENILVLYGTNRQFKLRNKICF